MALAETLSIEKLQELYEDDWHNAFSPIALTDTNLLGSVGTETLANDHQVQSRLNDIFERQAEIELLFGDLDQLPELVRQVNSGFSDVRQTVEDLRVEQQEMRGFLDDILDFENQEGRRI